MKGRIQALLEIISQKQAVTFSIAMFPLCAIATDSNMAADCQLSHKMFATPTMLNAKQWTSKGYQVRMQNGGVEIIQRESGAACNAHMYSKDGKNYIHAFAKIVTLAFDQKDKNGIYNSAPTEHVHTWEDDIEIGDKTEISISPNKLPETTLHLYVRKN